jgi:hypothetical protein
MEQNCCNDWAIALSTEEDDGGEPIPHEPAIICTEYGYFINRDMGRAIRFCPYCGAKVSEIPYVKNKTQGQA